MNKKAIFQLILVLISLLSVFAFVAMAPTYVTPINSDLKHYNDNQISFDFPANWEVSYYENRVGTLFLPSPDELSLCPTTNAKSKGYSSNTSKTENLGTKVTISKNNALKSGITLENAYIGDDIYVLMKSSPDFKFVSKTPVNANSVNGYEFIFETNIYTYQEVWLEKNGKYYTITGETLKNSFNSQKTNFDTIINSFIIK